MPLSGWCMYLAALGSMQFCSDVIIQGTCILTLLSLISTLPLPLSCWEEVGCFKLDHWCTLVPPQVLRLRPSPGGYCSQSVCY